ncbi:MAG: hypothetical protein FD180_1167 [Planctomycetota bacterium]|nr:MAG: hypothetical protein FD180_1167 [Planctomycetota bacterium]
MDSTVYPNKDVIVASKTAVNVFCHGEAKHEAKKKYGTEEWCEHVYGLTCEEHNAIKDETSHLFFKGSISCPTTILCMPDGTEIKRKVGSMPNKELIEMIKEAATKVGPGLGQDEYLFGKGKLKASEDALKAGKTKDAIDALNAGNKTIGKNPAAKAVVDQIKAELEKLNKAGLDLIAKAKEDVAAGKVDEGKKALLEVSKNYKTLECAKEADKEIAALPKAK